MYKDKDNQKEANRQASQRMTQKMSNEGMTARNGIVDVILSSDTPDKQMADAAVKAALGESAADKAISYIKDLRADYPKRGKDIKSFKDLPPDVQAIIHRQSDNNVEFKKRTDIAINYQRQLPDRYHSTGVQ